MLLRTELEILRDYESRGMLNLDAALYALGTDKDAASGTIADEERIKAINLLAFTHVEGPAIAKELVESRAKCPLEEAIAEKHYRKVLKTDLDMAVISENERQELVDTINKYLIAKDS